MLRSNGWPALGLLHGTSTVLLAAMLLGGCVGVDRGAVGYRIELGRAPNRFLLAQEIEDVLRVRDFSLTIVSDDLIQTAWRVRELSQAEAPAAGGAAVDGTAADDSTAEEPVAEVRDRAVITFGERQNEYAVAQMKVEYETCTAAGRCTRRPPPEEVVRRYLDLRHEISSRLQRHMNQY